jgi:16S rRNA (adenine1518-N6/adenine1519-N6)-dimethyltransferase
MRQQFGQNFLTNKNIARDIVMAAEPGPDDTVIEIGPGKGVLTEIIAPLVKELIAVELDRDLAGRLTQHFSGTPHVHIVSQDFLQYPLPAVPAKFIANLPYYLGTAIIEKILLWPQWRTAVLMVQKEVAERIAAPVHTPSYGYFSLFSQYYAETRIIMNVDPGAFSPRPKVDSAVIELKNKMPPAPDPHLWWLIKLAFQQRRKTILNSIARALELPKETVAKMLEMAKIDPLARPETLTITQYQSLTSLVKKDIIS